MIGMAWPEERRGGAGRFRVHSKEIRATSRPAATRTASSAKPMVSNVNHSNAQVIRHGKLDKVCKRGSLYGIEK